MNRYIFFIFLILGLIFFIFSQNNKKSSPLTERYTLEGKEYRLLPARTSQEWQKGLMDIRKKPEGVDGMIFYFPQKELKTFWNQNTYLDLDVYWLDDDKIVGKELLPSIEKKGLITITSPGEVNRVIEIIRQ